jgi:hypothetical protein
VNAHERAHRASNGLIAFVGIKQRRAAELIGMDEKRLSERLSQGTLFLRDFLTIAAEEGGADFLRMLANQMDEADASCRPIDAVMTATESAATAQGVVRSARADGVFCHYEVLEMRRAADAAEAAAVRFKKVVEGMEPGPVRAEAAE